MMMMIMMLTVGLFWTTCSDMFQIMFKILQIVSFENNVTMWYRPMDQLTNKLELLLKLKITHQNTDQ